MIATTREYVIWSIEHQAWWPASRMGYVLTLAEAGHFSQTEAMAIVARANYPPGTFHECMIPTEALGVITHDLDAIGRLGGKVTIATTKGSR